MLALIVFADKVLNPLIFFSLSTIMALLAETVPAVMSSITSNSLSSIFALPIIKEPLAEMLPELVMVPELTVPSPDAFPLLSIE